MGVPSRFAVEYPARVLQLITLLEPGARKRDLLGSFGLLAAAAVLTIPYERMNSSHFLHKRETDRDLSVALKKLDKVPFFRAPFWHGKAQGYWRQSRIVSNVENVDAWLDDEGRHPLSKEAANRIDDRTRSAADVVRVLRNALAHGNIIYLDKDFRESVDRRMTCLAFLSRYEDPSDGGTKTYRLVVTSEEEFLGFVKLWAEWVGGLADDGKMAEAA